MNDGPRIPWSRLKFTPREHPGRVLDFAIRTARRLREWDVECPPGNRLDRITETLRWYADPETALAPGDTERRALILEASRAAIEMYIGTHGPSRVSDALRSKAREMLSGSDLPTMETDHWGRNVQFEVYFHGLLSAAGLDVWFDERPDLRWRHDGYVSGIAVKRVWSLEQAHKRLSEAALQIEATELPGLIATNVQEHLSGVPETHDVRDRGAGFERDTSRLTGQMPWLMSKPHLWGVALCGITGSWRVPSGNKSALQLASFHALRDLNGETKHGFGKAYHTAMEDELKRWYIANT